MFHSKGFYFYFFHTTTTHSKGSFYFFLVFFSLQRRLFVVWPCVTFVSQSRVAGLSVEKGEEAPKRDAA